MKENIHLLLIILFSVIFYSTVLGANVVINEIMADNDTTIADMDGDYSDWIELFNPGTVEINLENYALTDDIAQPRKWILPSVTIGTGSFVLVWCSGKDRKEAELHTNFKLNKGGEFIGLYDPAGGVADSLTFPEMREDRPFGRYPDGDSNWVELSQPTPGSPNLNETVFPRTAIPIASPDPGFYSGSQTIVLNCVTPQAKIFYTLDASKPDSTSILYRQPIQLSQTTVVRARAVKEGYQPGQIMSHVYFFGEPFSRLNLPVISLVTSPVNLWDPLDGIYANATERGREWERPVSLEYFDKGGQFSLNVDAGLRIHGGASRKKSEKHSFRLYFRSDYGPAKLDFPIIPGSTIKKFDNFILRAGYNDGWAHRLSKERKAATYIRDEFVRNLFRNLKQPASAGGYVNLYLNGEFWGLYNIVERYNDDYFDHYFGGGNWDVVKPGPDEDDNAIEATEGDLYAWNDLVSWFNKADFTKLSEWETLHRRIDFKNLLDFYIVNVWIQNTDWPRHNWYAVHKRDDAGAKWKFLPWDAETTMGGGGSASKYNVNILATIRKTADHPLSKLYDKLNSSPFWGDTVLTRLPIVKDSLLNRDTLNALLTYHANLARPGISGEGERWGNLYAPDYSYGLPEWESAVNFVRDSFFVKRDQIVSENLKDLAVGGNTNPDSLSEITDYALLNNYPNPFNRSTTIQMELPFSGIVDLELFDSRGQLVKTFYKNKYLFKGRYLLKWEGKNNKYSAVSSGIYLLKLKSGQHKRSQRLLLIK